MSSFQAVWSWAGNDLRAPSFHRENLRNSSFLIAGRDRKWNRSHFHGSPPFTLQLPSLPPPFLPLGLTQTFFSPPFRNPPLLPSSLSVSLHSATNCTFLSNPSEIPTLLTHTPPVPSTSSPHPLSLRSSSLGSSIFFPFWSRPRGVGYTANMAVIWKSNFCFPAGVKRGDIPSIPPDI